MKRKKRMAIERSTAIGVFTDNLQAQRCIEELRKAGFTDQQVGYITRNGGTMEMPAGETHNTVAIRAAAGIVGGGVVGSMLIFTVTSLLPTAEASLTGAMTAVTVVAAVLSAVIGGFVGTLIDVGVPAAEASYYQQELKKGRTIVTVKAGARYRDALVVLRQSEAYDASCRKIIPEYTMTDAIPAAPVPAVLPLASIDADQPK
jgi:hypothetical protein